MPRLPTWLQLRLPDHLAADLEQHQAAIRAQVDAIVQQALLAEVHRLRQLLPREHGPLTAPGQVYDPQTFVDLYGPLPEAGDWAHDRWVLGQQYAAMVKHPRRPIFLRGHFDA